MGVLREERSLVDPESLSELWVQIAEPNHSLYSSSGNGLWELSVRGTQLQTILDRQELQKSIVSEFLFKSDQKFQQ